MKTSIRVQLSAMMFLEFFIWGAWFVTLGTYLSQSLSAGDADIGKAFGTQSWGAIVAPFIIGLIADRYFSAQKILGILHLGGAALMYFLSTAGNFNSFFPLLLGYMILYMPTLALVNSVSFNQLKDPEKEFSPIRVFGTIGWIVAGLLIGFMGWEADKMLVNTFRLTAIMSLVLGLFSFTLPNTPPPKAGTKASIREILGLDALQLLSKKNFLLFFLSSLLICVPLAFYYQDTNPFLNEIGMEGAAGKMALGQVSELGFMFLIPFFFKRLGVKKMLLLGMAAWVIRYVCFAYGSTGSLSFLLYLGILLHGVCYDFFFVTGQIYTDQQAGTRIRSAAQGMITLATYGLGMLIGFYIAGKLSGYYKVGDLHNWRMIWLVPAGIAAAVMVLFLVFFKQKNSTEPVAEPK